MKGYSRPFTTNFKKIANAPARASAALGIFYKDCWFAPSAAMLITGRPLAKKLRKAKNEIMLIIAVLVPMLFALVENEFVITASCGPICWNKESGRKSVICYKIDSVC